MERPDFQYQIIGDEFKFVTTLYWLEWWYSTIKKKTYLCEKIRTLAFKVINSPTILLPAWKKLCAEEVMEERLIPRDVRTRWNSTYDTMRFILNYRSVVQRITTRAYELTSVRLAEEEWDYLEQLVVVLKV